MDGDVTKKNVQQLRVLPIQNRSQRADFSLRNLPRTVADLPKPEPSHKMHRRLSDDVDLIERKAVRILAFLSDNNRSDAAKAGNLPVNVQHLRLEKGRAIKRGDRS